MNEHLSETVLQLLLYKAVWNYVYNKRCRNMLTVNGVVWGVEQVYHDCDFFL